MRSDVLTVGKMSMLVFFRPEDGGSKFLQNVSIYPQDYRAILFRKPILTNHN
jgi:hypothetical protein